MNDVFGLDLQAQVVAQFQARRAKMKHLEVASPEQYPELDGGYTIGNYSRTWLKHHTRAILGGKAIPVGGGLYDTPTAYARETLKVWYPKRVRHWTAAQWERLHQPDITMPVYAYPCRFCDGYYIDIKSAWWAILKRSGWGVDYYPYRWMKPDQPIPAGAWAGETHKTARSALVSIGLSRGIWMNDGEGNQYFKRAWNVFYNRDIFAWIAAVLGAVAEECRIAGAVYWNVDGAIYPTQESAIRGMSILDSWCLGYGCKGDGGGWVRGPGNYKLGGWGGGRVNDKVSQYDARNRPDAKGRAWVYDRWLYLLRRYGDL